MNSIKAQVEMRRYIKELLHNQNLTNTELLQDIFSKKDYLLLLKPVLQVMKDNPFDSFTTLRYKLFERSGLREIIKYFVEQTRITPGVILDFGTELSRDTIVCGNSQEVPYKKAINHDTIFDLASTSKLFTAIAVLKLEELDLLDLFAPITSYAPEFKNLDEVTVYDLLKFRVSIITDTRVDSAKSKEEAEEILFTAYKAPNQDIKNAYTDMGAMVLRYVVEKAAKMPFDEFVKEIIFKPVGMKDTYLNVPMEKLHRVANENYSSIITSNGIEISKNDIYPGIPHDAKAQAIGHSAGIAPGHAGYFSTTKDMINLGQALIDGKILNKEAVLSLSDNAVGNINESGEYSYFYGSLTYLKQPDPKYLSVYPPLSGRAFMSPGFAGTTLYVDPINKITLFIGSNRLHNRIYQVHPNQTKNIKINEHRTKTFLTQNEEEKIICSSYTGDKDVMVKLALDLSLQLQLLERFMPRKEKMHFVREL